MNAGSETHCYAVRRVNPFIGVCQVVETPVGRATSTSGVHWDLEIRTDRARVLGGLEQDTLGRAFIRFGLWSAKAGHVLANSRHLLRQDHELRDKSERLIAELLRRKSALPFALADSHELWLFDANGDVPLALLATRVPGQPLATPEPGIWRCSLGGVGGPGQRRFDDGSALEDQVKRRAGFNVKKTWVVRAPDGTGVRQTDRARFLSGQLPGLLIQRRWEAVEAAERVERYLGWIAPSLLTLPTIDDEERDWLERRLHLQAASVDHHWQLYPKVLSPKRIKAARVQSRLAG